MGFDADLLLVDGNPTENIADIRQLAMVITQGKAMYPTEIYQAMGIKPFVTNLPSIERLPSPASQAGGSVNRHRHHHQH